MISRRALRILFAAANLAALLGTASGQEQPKITTTRLAENVFLLQPSEESSSGNVIALIGNDGVLLVDSGLPETAAAFREAVDSLHSPNPTIKYIVNTHWHRDHAGGNRVLGKDAVIVSHENARTLMTSPQTLLGSTIQPWSPAALPQVTFRDFLTLHFDGEVIAIEHYPNAHTGNDAVVQFTNAKVIAIGDLYYGKVLPWVDADHGGDVIGLRQALEKLIHLAGIKIIAPGHEKAIETKDLVAEQRVIDETLTTVRRGISEGLSLKQIQDKGLGDEWKSWEWVGNSIPAWIQSVHTSLLRAGQSPQGR
jgi:cyclase